MGIYAVLRKVYWGYYHCLCKKLRYTSIHHIAIFSCHLLWSIAHLELTMLLHIEIFASYQPLQYLSKFMRVCKIEGEL